MGGCESITQTYPQGNITINPEKRDLIVLDKDVSGNDTKTANYAKPGIDYQTSCATVNQQIKETGNYPAVTFDSLPTKYNSNDRPFDDYMRRQSDAQRNKINTILNRQIMSEYVKTWDK